MHVTVLYIKDFMLRQPQNAITHKNKCTGKICVDSFHKMTVRYRMCSDKLCNPNKNQRECFVQYVTKKCERTGKCVVYIIGEHKVKDRTGLKIERRGVHSKIKQQINTVINVGIYTTA